MKKLILSVILAVLTTTSFAVLPLVLGKTNPLVTQENINTTICVSGWTKTVRPTVAYTNKLKLKQIKQFGLKGTPQDYEEDHKINLGLGGHPTSPDNLYPQLLSGPANAHEKDAIEVYLQRLVCKNGITLKDAQNSINNNWIAAYEKYIGPISK